MRVFTIGCLGGGGLLVPRVSCRLACLLAPAILLLGGAVAAADPAQIMRSLKSLITKPKPVATEVSGVLVPVTEDPAGYEELVAASPYPKTDSPDKLTLEQLEAIAKLPPKANKAGLQTHPAMLPLFRDMVLRYTGGNYKDTPIHFRLHTPEKFKKGKKYPLVVWLHGAGECGSDNIDQLSHLHHIIPHLVGPKKRDFFLLVPQCPHSHRSWEAPGRCSTTVRSDGSVECKPNDDPVALANAPLSFTIEMVKAVTKKFPVDPNRVTVAGLSTGGRGVWEILERRPDLFAAAVPIVSWQAFCPQSLREKPLLKKIPIWTIYSSDDRGIDFAREEFERMKEGGCRVFKTEFGVCGHHAWTPAMLQGDIFGWLISRAKDGSRYYAAEPAPTDPEKIGIFADVTEGLLKQEPTPASTKAKKATKPAKTPSVAVTPKPRLAVTPKPRPKVGRLTSPPVNRGYRPPTVPSPSRRSPYLAALPYTPFDEVRMELVARYIETGEVEKALAVADKIKSNHQRLFQVLLHSRSGEIQSQLLDYVDRRLDRMEQEGVPLSQGKSAVFGGAGAIAGSGGVPFPAPRPARPRVVPKRETLQPIPAGKKTPMDDCGKEWSMSTTTQYGLFPSGWDKEAADVPGYAFNETGKQLYMRLAIAFQKEDLAAMKELCESFIKLDDIPLSSPWFDVSGGRLKGRIKYTLNGKAKPVVLLLRDIANVKADSKKEFVALAKKALERIEKITNPK